MRRSKFPNIPNLDTELDLIILSLSEMIGKKVSSLPLANQTPEMARFVKKLSSTQYEEYIKIDGAFRLLGGGGSGGSAYIEMRVSGGYIQWRDDPAGAWTNLIAIEDLKGEQGDPGPPGTVEDGDKGDITVASSGTVFTINPSKVTEGKIADNAVTQNKIANNAVVEGKIATDAVTEAKIKNNEVSEAKLKLADNTTANVSTSRHGLMPKLPNDADKFLNGVGDWVSLTVIITAQALTVLSCNNYGFEVIDLLANGVVIS